MEDKHWPGMGAWLPDAVEALRELDSLGHVVIFTLRVAPVDIDGKTWRPPGEKEREAREITRMLDEEGLGHIEVWTNPWKPPALVYIDDRGWRFTDWVSTIEFVQELIASGVSYAPHGNVPAGLEDVKDEVTFEPVRVECCDGCPMCEDAGVPADDCVTPIFKAVRWYENDPRWPGRTEEAEETFIGIEEYEFEQRITDGETGGQKGRKLARFALIPWSALRALARHYGVGALKYDDDNWRQGYDWDLSIDALERHFSAWKGGESVYVERFTGRDGKNYVVETNHLIAVAWQAFTLYVFERLGLGKDTRKTA